MKACCDLKALLGMKARRYVKVLCSMQALYKAKALCNIKSEIVFEVRELCIAKTLFSAIVPQQ